MIVGLMTNAAQQIDLIGHSGKALSNRALDELKRSFEAVGYVVVRNVISRPKLAELHANILSTFENKKRTGELMAGGGLFSGHLNCFPGEGSRFIYDELRDAGLLDFIKTIFSKPTGNPFVGCNLNLPNSVVQHYHVDSNFLQEFMIANVAVVDTEIANGAIELVPGTHRQFYKFWRFAVERQQRNGVRIPMKQGDVLIRSSNLWHRGMPNRTSVPRPMVALRFVERGNVAVADPFHEGDGSIAFHENWFRPTLLGRLRERTFITAPISYDAYRFVRSLIGNKGYDDAQA